MVTGHNMTTGQQLKVKSMIDSSNTLHCRVAITDACQKELGLKYYSMRTKTVGTADKTRKMIQLGISEEFELQIDGIREYWLGRASVVKGLSDEVNIRTATLIHGGEAREKTVYLAFTPKGTRLGWMEPGKEIGRPEEKMLIKTIKEIQEENKSKANADTDTWEPGTRDKGQPVYAMQDVTLKKNSMIFVKCDEFAEDMMIERKTSGLTGLKVVTALYAQGQDKIAVLNQRDSDVIIKKQVQIAER